jgi:hypothetical protein
MSAASVPSRISLAAIKRLCLKTLVASAQVEIAETSESGH